VETDPRLQYVRTCHSRMFNVHVPGGTFHEITCPLFTLSDFQEAFMHVTGGTWHVMWPLVHLTCDVMGAKCDKVKK
jgi:hypothetical protein